MEQRAAGKQAEEILDKSRKSGGYILVVEGGIPTRKGHGMIGNKEMLDVFKEMASPSVAVLAIGSCATTASTPWSRRSAKISTTRAACSRLAMPLHNACPAFDVTVATRFLFASSANA